MGFLNSEKTSNLLAFVFFVLQHIYEGGGRAFWIHNTGPIGCLPVQLFYKHNLPIGYLDQYGCIKDQNEMAIEFNKQLKNRVINLRTEIPDASITYVDAYGAKYGLISKAKDLGNHYLHTSLDSY